MDTSTGSYHLPSDTFKTLKLNLTDPVCLCLCAANRKALNQMGVSPSTRKVRHISQRESCSRAALIVLTVSHQ